MIKKICIVILILLSSCTQNKTHQKVITQKDLISKTASLKFKDTSKYKFYPNTNWLKIISKDSITENYWKKIIRQDSLVRKFKADFTNSFPLKDKTVNFLREGKEYKHLINEEYCKTMSEPERATLSFLAMSYDTAEAYYDKTLNKQSTILNALNLDSECSDRFKYYMKFWFRNDSKSLKEIDNCQKTSSFHGQSVYFGYSEINLTIKGNKIHIDFKAEGSDRDIWNCSWNGKLIFLVEDNNIKLIEKKESEEEYIYYSYNCSDVSPPDGYVNYGNGEYRLPKKSKKK